MTKRLILAFMAGLAACSGDSLRLDLSSATVELDVFSGRPNPRWQLTPQDASQLEDRLNGLQESSAVQIPSQLGYRGFRIIDENNQRLTVTNNGYVVMHEDSGDKFYRDTRDVQSWLKRQAEARGFGSLLIQK